MPGRIADDPQHWRNRAAQMRASATTTKDPEAATLMSKFADDYDRLADKAARRPKQAPIL